MSGEQRGWKYLEIQPLVPYMYNILTYNNYNFLKELPTKPKNYESNWWMSPFRLSYGITFSRDISFLRDLTSFE